MALQLKRSAAPPARRAAAQAPALRRAPLACRAAAKSQDGAAEEKLVALPLSALVAAGLLLGGFSPEEAQAARSGGRVGGGSFSGARARTAPSRRWVAGRRPAPARGPARPPTRRAAVGPMHGHGGAPRRRAGAGGAAVPSRPPTIHRPPADRGARASPSCPGARAGADPLPPPPPPPRSSGPSMRSGPSVRNYNTYVAPPVVVAPSPFGFGFGMPFFGGFGYGSVFPMGGLFQLMILGIVVSTILNIVSGALSRASSGSSKRSDLDADKWDEL
jgi:hypothetical protein